MKFALTEEQMMLVDSLGKLLSETCPSTRLHEIIDQQAPFDATLWEAVREFGLAGLCVPDEHGGSGLELLDAAVAMEVCGYYAAPLPLFGHTLSVLALRWCADDSLRKRLLPVLADGSAIGTVGLRAASGQWLPDDWTLVPANGRLTGVVEFVPAATEAKIMVVGLAGGGLGLVELDQPGVARELQDGVDRTRQLGRVSLDGAQVTVIGDAAAGRRLLDADQVLTAADAFGGARRAVDMAVDYAGEREQFGAKIGSFQGLQHQLANMYLEVEPCRALYWYAAYAFDHKPDDASASASLAKAHIAERYLQVARDSVEAHGGIGFTWEYDSHIWLKRAMFDYAWGGSPTVHRERYATLMGW